MDALNIFIVDIRLFVSHTWWLYTCKLCRKLHDEGNIEEDLGISKFGEI